MKLSTSKPISSPSRVENFPPPLMRFLRSNGGSRSRSGRRSRSSSSPMFVIRKKNASTGIETQTHEPSSPKVSCMGQVHVQRSKSKSKSKQTPTIKTPKCSCRWIREALFCKCCIGKSNPRLSFSDWRRRCCLFFHFGYRRKVEIVEETVKTESRRQFTVRYEENPREEEEKEEKEEEEKEEKEEEKEERVFASSSSSSSSSFSSTTPPKNALLLMRCRSDPCRNRFRGSPSVTEEKTEHRNKIEKEEKEEDEEIPTLEKEPIFIGSTSESRTDLETEEKLGFCEGFENLSNGRKNIKIRNETLMKVNGGFSSSSSSSTTSCSSSSSSRPLPLTLARCKSESETGCWNKRKSGFNEKCPPLLL